MRRRLLPSTLALLTAAPLIGCAADPELDDLASAVSLDVPADEIHRGNCGFREDVELTVRNAGDRDLRVWGKLTGRAGGIVLGTGIAPFDLAAGASTEVLSTGVPLAMGDIETVQITATDGDPLSDDDLDGLEVALIDRCVASGGPMALVDGAPVPAPLTAATIDFDDLDPANCPFNEVGFASAENTSDRPLSVWLAYVLETGMLTSSYYTSPVVLAPGARHEFMGAAVRSAAGEDLVATLVFASDGDPATDEDPWQLLDLTASESCEVVE